MSKFPDFATRTVGAAALALALSATVSAAEQAAVLAENPAPVRDGGYGLGVEALPEEIAVWDIDVRPDGVGLPEGSGDVATGEELYMDNCAMCHGDFGEGAGRWPVLAGGAGSLTDERPVKTIGSYWPYLSTVYDYVHRAMPFMNSQTLSDDEVYAITAYLLYLNDLVDDDFVLSKENFTEIHLPNEDGFIPDDRLEVEFPEFTKEPCMTNCKDDVQITMRAAVLDVTPEDSGVVETDDMASEGEDHAAAEAAPSEAAEAAAAPEPAFDPELAKAGEKVFRKCKSCHQVGPGAKNRAGPVLTGIVGKPAAHVEGFEYSKAMREAAEAGLVWDEANLREFLKKPKAFLKGTKMSFGGLKKESDLDAVIEYLKSTAATN